jgi:hypothetical protein
MDLAVFLSARSLRGKMREEVHICVEGAESCQRLAVSKPDLICAVRAKNVTRLQMEKNGMDAVTKGEHDSDEDALDLPLAKQESTKNGEEIKYEAKAVPVAPAVSNKEDDDDDGGKDGESPLQIPPELGLYVAKMMGSPGPGFAPARAAFMPLRAQVSGRCSAYVDNLHQGHGRLVFCGCQKF